MYSISAYGGMIADTVRMPAYEEALRRSVKPGSVVVDIGTGTGIFALMACRFGARKVYAIEPDDSIQVARQIAVDNGYADRIEFISDLSTRIELPELADVIVSDLRGVLPLYSHHFSSIADARGRLLSPGGILIPMRDRIWISLVHAPEQFERHMRPWHNSPYGLKTQAAQTIVANTWRKANFKPEQLLVEPQCWSTIDYRSIESPNCSNEHRWNATESNVIHGLAVWFDTDLVEGVGFSNAPGQTEAIYGNAFFPWSKPVECSPGDLISVKLSADLVGDDYIWRWSIAVQEAGSPTAKIKLDQSTFFGSPLSLTELRKRAASFVPSLDIEGQIDHLILSMMDGKNSLSEIAKTIQERFPDRFSTLKAALTKAGDLSKKYGA